MRLVTHCRAFAALALAACASAPGAGQAQPAASAATTQARRDSAGGQSSDAGLIPPNYGSLRLDDVAISVQLQGLTIRAIPLDESVIRALAPDSYGSLHALREAHAAELGRIRARLGLGSVQAWHVQFFNVQQGEARYDPRGVQIRSAGRDFRPLDVIPLVTGFEDGRLAQGRSVNAIFAFDPAVSLSQPLVVTLAGQSSSAWSDVLPRLERERAAVWSRAAAARKP
jgi:hypothetical protein